jgi:hypothetical protein
MVVGIALRGLVGLDELSLESVGSDTSPRYVSVRAKGNRRGVVSRRGRRNRVVLGSFVDGDPDALEVGIDRRRDHLFTVYGHVGLSGLFPGPPYQKYDCQLSFEVKSSAIP